MTVIESKVSKEGMSGTGDSEFKGSRRLVWIIKTDDMLDGPQVVMDNAPFVGPHPLALPFDRWTVGNEFNPWIVARKATAERIGKSLLWKVTVEYTQLELLEDGDNNPNPLLRPIKYRIDWANYTRLTNTDKDGTPITNSAGQITANPPHEEEDGRPIIVATRNEAVIGSILANAIIYNNSINTNAFTVGPLNVLQFQARMLPIVCGDQRTENGIAYYPVTYKVELKGDPDWLTRLRDAGTAVLNGGNLEVARDPSGVPYTEPVLLDGAGAVLPAGGTPVINTWHTKKEANWAPLALFV